MTLGEIVGAIIGAAGVGISAVAVYYARRADQSARDALALARQGLRPARVLFAQRMLQLLHSIVAERERVSTTGPLFAVPISPIVDPYAYGLLEDAARDVGHSGEVLQLRRMLNAIASQFAASDLPRDRRAACAAALGEVEQLARTLLRLGPDDPIPTDADLAAHIERYG